jgi:RNA recognition motif-containing protein
MKIFVGNLAFVASQVDLQRLFEGFGVVTSAVIVMERKEAKSRGFGFVEMPDDQESGAAIASLDGKEFMGRTLNVSLALSKLELRPKKNKKETNSNPDTEIASERSSRKNRKDFTRGSFFEENRGYKEGRRSLSFFKRHKLSGPEEQSRPKRKSQGNPMRWRKKGQSKPWDKLSAGSEPLRKTAEGADPWKKDDKAAGPWQKSDTGPRPRIINPGRPQRPSFRRHKISGSAKRRKTG